MGGLYQDIVTGGGLGAHQVVEYSGGFVSGAVGIESDAAERGFAEFAEQRVVVNAQHQEVVGYPDALFAACFDNVASALIHGSKDTETLGQFCQPGTEVEHLIFPAYVGVWRLVGVAGVSMAGDKLVEGLGTGG